MLIAVRLVSKICKYSLLSLIIEIIVGALVYTILVLIYLIKKKNKYLYLYLNKIRRIRK